jgi:hypothetical protein
MLQMSELVGDCLRSDLNKVPKLVSLTLEFLVRSSQQPRSLHPKALDSCISLATGYPVSLVLLLSEVHTKNVQTIARFQPDIWPP